MKTTENTIFKKWLSFAKKVGDLQAYFVFKLFYFLIIVPLGFISNLFFDFLDTKNFPHWIDIEDDNKTIKQMRQQ